MDLELEGKVAIVTGASEGIGRACALRLSEEGAKVTICARRAPEGGHHNLFLMQTPDRRRGLNHVAFTVRDLHEVFGGGLHVGRCGWRTQIGPGRHPISSAYFWYVHNPAGGLAEYYADEDYCTADWKAQAWERAPERFAEWAIDGGIDGTTRRQARARNE